MKYFALLTFLVFLSCLLGFVKKPGKYQWMDKNYTTAIKGFSILTVDLLADGDRIIVFGKLFSGLFENKMLATTGMISYEIYLVHAFTLGMIKQSIISVFIIAVVTYVLAYILNIGMRKVKK